MHKSTPRPRDMHALAGWLTKAAAFADQLDWSGIDLDPVADMRLLSADLTQMAEEVSEDLRRGNELLAEKRHERHLEEANETRALMGATR